MKVSRVADLVSTSLPYARKRATWLRM